ncbi:hypothetical protein [Geminicoccus flavidas]|uniref:hypothetical protein n=1 Tax=Geminicoccus flavidas TaxID=2506407 RepID=UPI00190F3BCC|nr:hypothetical protein [Geminicoccus flavidas]
MLLDQRHHQRRPPLPDRIEIDAQVPVSGAGEGMGLVLAGAEGDPDAAVPVLRPHFRNLQGWVTLVRPRAEAPAIRFCSPAIIAPLPDPWRSRWDYSHAGISYPFAQPQSGFKAVTINLR